jgi:hypothetical protein
MKYLSISIALIVCVLWCLFLYAPTRPLNLDDCLEFGVCAEGLELKDDGKDIIMTKEFCKEHNYTWIENASACDTRNRTNKEK